MDRFITSVLEEIKVIRHASLIFITALLVVGGLLAYGIWQAMDWRYSGVIANMNAELSSARTQRDEYKEKLQGASPDQAKARLDDLEARIRRWEPRNLSPEQRAQIAKFVQVPAGFTYMVSIGTDMNCYDCHQYATDFHSVLADAHWAIQSVLVARIQGSSPKGLAVATPDPASPLPEAIALEHALTAAGIPFERIRGGDAKQQFGGSGKQIAQLLITLRATAYSSTPK